MLTVSIGHGHDIRRGTDMYEMYVGLDDSCQVGSYSL